MISRDQNTIDLAQQTLRLAEDVVVWPVKERGEVTYRLEIPALHRFFRVGYEEYVLISLLDGKTTIAQACGLAAAAMGPKAPGGRQAESIQRWLLKNELAYLPSHGPPDRRKAGGANRREQAVGWLHRFNPFWTKIPLSFLARWVQPVAEKLRWCFSAPSLIISTLLIVIATFALLGGWDRFTDQTLVVFSPHNFVWLFASWLVLKLVHETAHAVACHRYGGEVQDVGIVLILFAPLAYVDVTSCWRMNSRWSRIAVSGAGMFAEVLVASIAVLVWRWTESLEVECLMRNVVITASVTTILFNANALMRFDGYYILADAIDVSNLYQESMSSVKRLANRWLTGRVDHGGNLIGWRRHFVLIYGLAAITWKVIVSFTLVVAASTLFSGAGIALAAFGLMMWLGRPLGQLCKVGTELWHQERTPFLRAAVLSGVFAAIAIAAVTWVPIPTAVTTSAVTEYLPATILRSGASGFVRHIHVQHLSTVQPGDLLIELVNPELSNQRRSLEIELAKNEIHQRQAASGHDASMVSVLQEKHRSLRVQLDQVHSQLQGLRVVAHRSGQVISRDLSTKLGTYVREGDHLMFIADTHEKEVVAVVSQDAIRQARRSINDTVAITSADLSTYAGTLQRIDPRASDHLPVPSLAATAGGPLAVRRNDEGTSDDQGALALLEPHFLARVSLPCDAASELPAGMRMQASFGCRTEPLITRLRIAINDIVFRMGEPSSSVR